MAIESLHHDKHGANYSIEWNRWTCSATLQNQRSATRRTHSKRNRWRWQQGITGKESNFICLSFLFHWVAIFFSFLWQVVTDFDFTLTKQKTEDGKPVLSSFGMFNKCKSLPKSFLDESKKLYEKYRPIEICPKMTQDEKRKHMIDWWVSSGDLLK